VNAQARRRVAFVLVAIAAAGAVGIATWQMLTGRPIGAGLGALAPARCRASRVPPTMFPCMPGGFAPAGCGGALP